MRDPKRIEKVLAKLRDLWLTYPDLRFFQVVDVLKSQVEHHRHIDPYFLEDDKLILDYLKPDSEDTK